MTRAAILPRRLGPAALAACLLTGAAGCTSDEGGASPGGTTPASGRAGGQAQPQLLSPTGTAGPCRHIQSAGTRPIARPERATSTVTAVRIERHSCADWVVFRLSGKARTGANVQYQADSDSALGVVVHTPGGSAVRPAWKAGEAVAAVPTGTLALRRVSFAGKSASEARFTVATTGRLPFTVVWRPVVGGSELVLEIAHQATA